MKKGEQPEFTAKWWKSSQPKGLKSAGKLEDALKEYESVRKKLESGGDPDAVKSVKDALGAVESAVDAVVSEASKDKKNPEMGFTVDALKKFDRGYATEQAWIEEHGEEDDDGMFSDPEVYQAYLVKGLKRLRSSGQMNFGMVLGKKAEDHRLALHKSKSPKALASMVARETGLRQMTFGTAVPDENRALTLMLNLEGRQLAGIKKKGERMLKKFKPLPFIKLVLLVDGQEVEDLADPEDTDTDEVETEEGTNANQAATDEYDAAALKRELAALVQRVQALTDRALKGDLGRLASQANAGLNGNNLGAAARSIEALREALDAGSATNGQGNGPGNGQGAQNGGNGASVTSETFDKSRQTWLATRKKVETEIEKLRAEIATTYQNDGIAPELDRLYRAKVAPVLQSLDESLAATLNEAAKTTDAARRAALVTEAQTIMQGYQSFLASDPTIGLLDSNPFVPLSIQQTVSATLSALGRTVH